MGADNAALVKILAIGHESSIRGTGLPLGLALETARYRELRPHFTALQLLPILHSNPALQEQWLMYSLDKRTSEGWYLLESGEVGQVHAPASVLHPETFAESVAAYVVRELDFWAGYGQQA